jgi:outer membrane protein assembly factor BamD
MAAFRQRKLAAPRTIRYAAALVLACGVLFLLAACGGKKKDRGTPGASAEPDKLLFERGMADLKKGHYAVARLTFETLINTYPDSEYLAKAKLAIADSYYKEGGTSSLTRAVAEYKDFITFFPFLEEAPYAQMQLAMTHYRRMEKPDRDRQYALSAEEEFQNFLLKYPDSPPAAEAAQRLREVQEVLAEGEFRVSRFYYIKGSYRAAAARLLETVDRYPLYSQADQALWMLAQTFERAEKGHIAANYYTRIVRDYPLSPLLSDATAKLQKLGVPVPQPNPEAQGRMHKERELRRERPGMLRRSLGMFKSGPDVSMAGRVGQPNLAMRTEPTSPLRALTAEGNLAVSVVGPGGASASAPAPSRAEGAGGSAPPAPSGAVGAASPAAAGSSPASEGNAPPASAATDVPAKPQDVPANPQLASDSSNPQDAGKDKKDDDNKKKKKDEKDSSSKKKKGLRRIIPW